MIINQIAKGGGANTADATAAQGEILATKTAYIATGKATGSMANVGAQSITPTAAGVAITAGYHNGSGGTAAEADLVAGNIKKDVNIFGVVGNYDTEVANPIAAGTVLINKIGFVNGAKVTGTMVNVGAQTAAITTKAGTVTPTAGYHNGAGSISIHADEQAKIIAGNIKSGVTILGQAGSANVVDTTSGDAVAGDIASGKKAWVDGAEITGTKGETNWAGTLSFSGTFATDSYYVAARSDLVVNPTTGVAIISVKSAHATYRHIECIATSVPAGVTMTDFTNLLDSYNSAVLYAARFDGITGKINVAIALDSIVNNTVQAEVTMTYV